MNPALSELPAFLVREGGLHSGLMMAQVTAAALVSECKILAHPASVDSIPTSAAKEDHVSMSPIAARKFAAIVDNLERVLAIEPLAAFQAMEFLRPLALLGAPSSGCAARFAAWSGPGTATGRCTWTSRRRGFSWAATP